jgi:hypothetical protein
LVKILKFFYVDLGSRIPEEKNLDPGAGIRDEKNLDPGSGIWDGKKFRFRIWDPE